MSASPSNIARPAVAGRPRDPSIEARVLQAAREELAERGVAGFSMRQVAARAGVARPSLLLRWPDWETLVIDALDDIAALPPLADTGSLRGDLLALADDLDALLRPPMLDLRHKLAGEAARYPELYARFQQKVMQPAARRAQAAFTRAINRSEISPGAPVRWIIEALVGGLTVRTLSTPGLLPPDSAERVQLVDLLLCSVRPRTQTADSGPQAGNP